MSSLILLILLGVMVLGVFLVALGWRGRRINRHPQCRWCGFDLDGVYPATHTCPECGGGLKKAGMVRIGVRRRLPLVIVLGAVCAILPLAPVAAVAYAAMTGANLNTYKPLWLLLWEARHTAPAQAEGIAAEVFDRVITQKLDAEATRRVMLAALDIQADLAAPWSEKWGDLIERGLGDKTLGAAEQKRYTAHMCSLKVEMRARVRAGGLLPVFVTPADIRISSTSQQMVPIQVTSAALDDDKPLRVRLGNGYGGGMTTLALGMMPETPVGYLYIMSAKTSGQRWYGGQEASFALRVPDDAAAGARTVSLALGLTPQPWGNSRMVRPSEGSVPSVSKIGVEILPSTTPTTELVSPLAPTPALTARLKRAFASSSVRSQTTEYDSGILPALGVKWFGTGTTRTHWLTVTFSLDSDLPPMAFDCAALVGDKTVALGVVTSTRSAFGSSQPYGGSAGTYVTSLSATLPAAEGAAVNAAKSIDLVFTPSAKNALLTKGMTTYYNEKITLQNVPVTFYDSQGQPAVPPKVTKAKANPAKKAEDSPKPDHNPKGEDDPAPDPSGD
ncbi:hypothetical protein BH11PLA1_BH11PLA1_15260 [soil metagenome]